MASELAGLQAWFLEAVTHPGGVTAGAAAASAVLPRTVEEVCLPSEHLTATDRVGIYAGMYFTRLVEVLEDDFPALAALLGSEGTARLFHDFLVRHPSSHPNLNQLGRGLADFLESEASDVPHRELAVEVARLERGIQEVFDAERATALATDELLAIPREAWGGLRLALAPSVRLLAFEHPTNAWYQGWREGEAPAPPEPPERERTWLALYRRDFRVWRQPLGPEEHRILLALASGSSLGEALEGLAVDPELDVAAVGRSLAEWFRTWSGLGFFVGTS